MLDKGKTKMKTLIFVAALLAASPAFAQQTFCSGFSNGMGFCYGPNSQHDTFTFRKGTLSAQEYNPPQLIQPQGVEPLLPDNN
jgi:hypothetical protein